MSWLKLRSRSSELACCDAQASVRLFLLSVPSPATSLTVACGFLRARRLLWIQRLHPLCLRRSELFLGT